MAARINDRQLELVLCRLEIIDCKHCFLPLPAAMFARCVVRGKSYPRSWCKFCEAWRERLRHKRLKSQDEMASVRRNNDAWAAWDAHSRQLYAGKH